MNKFIRARMTLLAVCQGWAASLHAGTSLSILSPTWRCLTRTSLSIFNKKVLLNKIPSLVTYAPLIDCVSSLLIYVPLGQERNFVHASDGGRGAYMNG